MQRYIISSCLAFSLLGCGTVGVTWTEQEQVKPVATMNAESGLIDCGLASGAKTRVYGISVFDNPNIAAAQANAITLGGAAYFISVCTNARVLEKASGISYGAGGEWDKKEDAKYKEALKLASKAIKAVDALGSAMEADWNTRNGQGGSNTAPTATPAPAIVAPNLVDSIDASQNYPQLIAVLEYEAASNPGHADICKKFAAALRAEMAKPKNDFAYDRGQVRKAFKR